MCRPAQQEQHQHGDMLSDEHNTDAVLSVTQESFKWTEQWYPVAVVADLDPGKPHATKLLGMLKAHLRHTHLSITVLAHAKSNTAMCR